MDCTEYLEAMSHAAWADLPITIIFCGLVAIITWALFRVLRKHWDDLEGETLFFSCVIVLAAAFVAVSLFAGALGDIHSAVYPEGGDDVKFYCAENPPTHIQKTP